MKNATIIWLNERAETRPWLMAWLRKLWLDTP